MTCDEGLTEGLGRALAVRTREEATGVTVAIPVAPVLPSLPLAGNCRELTMPDNDVPEGPIAPRNADDPTKSDEFDQNELAQKSPGYAAALMESAVANATAPLKARIAALEGEVGRRQAANNMLVRRTDELTEGLKAKEAQPASAVKRSSPMMKAFTAVMFAAMSFAIGWLYSANERLDKKLDSLTVCQVQAQFGSPEALKGKTYLELTPEMEQLGVEKFIPIAEHLPYADAATMERLITRDGVNKVAEFWNPTVADDRAVVLLKRPDGAAAQRSILIHAHPASIGVYADTKALDEHYYLHTVNAGAFVTKKHYDTDPCMIGVARVIAFAATTPPATHAELAKLGDFQVMASYDNERVIYLVAPFGTDERFMHLADADYQAITKRIDRNSSTGDQFRYLDCAWWHSVETDAAKEEERQTAVK
ncbi:MAG: hypothetical protein HYW56_01560 [Candidatus Harrisonbacteria bacterium]|nr:hypothetical protein [Candidatus Harrisonbacteria bacterium]